MRAAVYARLSKDRSGLSPNVAIQTAEAAAYITDELHGAVVGTWGDSDISASRYATKPRPGYDALIEAIRAGHVECVVVTEMTRLYRRLEELLELIRLAETTPLRRIETTDGMGYTLATGEGIHNAVSAVNNAVLESRKISDRVKRKKQANAVAGKNNGGSRPYGYEPGGVVIRESEAKVLRECVERIIAGESVSSLPRDLNERGITTAYGKHFRIENLKRLLENRRYLGIRTHNGAEYPAVWPAIITPEEHELVKHVYRQFQSAPTRPKGVRSYLLTGFAYCGRCGAPLIGSARTEGGQSNRRYRCRPMDNMGGSAGCGKLFRLAEPLETFVRDTVIYRLDTDDLARYLSAEDGGDDATELSRQFDLQQARLDDLVNDYATGLLDRVQFARAKQLAETALDQTRREMAKAQRQRTLLTIPAVGHLREAWDAANLDWRRQLLSLLVERVVVKPGHPGAKTWNGRRFDVNQVEIVWRA